MRYRLTCLTPVLVGDGSQLSPIDYMVWKDQINVLDQNRIFRLLAKGPRLDGYLKQIARADRLDFASWGGFAQNFAGRRIPFEHSSSTAYWQALPAEQLRIPTFSTSHAGPFVPGSALKGALRTALLAESLTSGAMKDLASVASGENRPRLLGQVVEDRFLGQGGSSRTQPIRISDSETASGEGMKVYPLRLACLAPGAPGRLELRWKQVPRGTVPGNRPGAGTPVFAEMAAPGSVFEGRWGENPYFRTPEVVKAMRWKAPLTTPDLMRAANASAERMLASHKRYAEVADLGLVRESLRGLEAKLADIRANGNACLVCIGWGGGFLSKSSGPSPSDESYRQILSQLSYYAKALASGLPFPKTRRIVFIQDQPAALPGWALLETH